MEYFAKYSLSFAKLIIQVTKTKLLIQVNQISTMCVPIYYIYSTQDIRLIVYSWRFVKLNLLFVAGRPEPTVKWFVNGRLRNDGSYVKTVGTS